MRSLSADETARADRLHSQSIVIDTLGAGGPSIHGKRTEARMNELIAQRVAPIQIVQQIGRASDEELIAGELPEYWDAWKASGVTAVSTTMGTYGSHFTYEDAIRDIAWMTRKFDALDRYVKITKAVDVERAHADGKHGVILNFQNSTHFGEDLAALELFYNLGVRVIQLTYNTRNFVGDGCTERNPAGLSNFGIKVVKRLNELGILVDVSHCGSRTSIDAAKYSEVPIAITHAFAQAIHQHDRGKSDEVIQAVGEKGYVGICVVPFFITADPKPTLDHWLAHVRHVVDLVGADHVGIGTDWGLDIPKPLATLLNEEMTRVFGFRDEHNIDWAAVVEGFESWTGWPNLTRALVSDGYSDEEIRGFLGENFLRIFRRAAG